MGITIYASGKIDGIYELPRLIEDVKAAAEKHNWTYRSINDDFGVQPNAALSVNEMPGKMASITGSLGLKGLILKMDPNVETLAVLFDCNGVLTDVLSQLSWIEGKGQEERFTACKTQYGSIDSHIRIVEFLDRLKKKYISNLTVRDEGAYWESRNRRLLAEKRVALGHFLRHAEKVISGIEISDADAHDPERIASKIEEALLKEEDG